MTLADALTAHEEALTYGGHAGIANLGLVESAVGRPYSGYDVRIWEKAASLLESMVQNHGFIDGNKRTAWIVVELFIERSGYRLDIDENEPVDDVVVNVARGDMDLDAVRGWFRTRLVKQT